MLTILSWTEFCNSGSGNSNCHNAVLYSLSDCLLKLKQSTDSHPSIRNKQFSGTLLWSGWFMLSICE